MNYNQLTDEQLTAALDETAARLRVANDALALALDAYEKATAGTEDDYDFSGGAAGLLATMTAPAAADAAVLQKARRAARALEAQRNEAQREQANRRTNAAYRALWAHVLDNEAAFRAVIGLIEQQAAATAGTMVPALIPMGLARELEHYLYTARQAAGR
jgi:hypothetical protein